MEQAIQLVLVMMAAGTAALRYDTFSGERIGADRERYLAMNNIMPWCSVDVAPCDPHERRRLDCSCNNLASPPRGATMTPYHRELPPHYAPGHRHAAAESGRALPSPRALRTALVSDGAVPSPAFTQLLTHTLVWLTGEVTSLHDTVNYVLVTTSCCAGGARAGGLDPRCQPIAVPDDDPTLRHSDVRCLNLTRAITYQRLGCAAGDSPPERINTSPPMLDMSLLYGWGAEAARLRTSDGGRLRTDERAPRFPPSGSPSCINNRPPLETRCHDMPNPGVNSIMGVNLLSLWWFRNHNEIASRLQLVNPCWSDELLYYTARDINVAVMQHILYYELVPLLIGREYALGRGVIHETDGHVDDYDEDMEPRLSIEYVIATRWFHTMQEGWFNLYEVDGSLVGRRAAVDDTLRTGALENNRTLERLTQGAFRQPCAHNDHLVDVQMGERSLGGLQRVSDVVAADIMKGRDVGLPPYNSYRRLCGLPTAHDWDDFRDTMDKQQVDVLMLMYESPADVELMPALLAEKSGDAAVLGHTLSCLLTKQLLRWRRADRFWYENTVHAGAFTVEQLASLRRWSMSRLLCDVGDDVTRIQPNAFQLPDEFGNKITSCEHIQKVSLEPWLDERCRKEAMILPTKTEHQ